MPGSFPVVQTTSEDSENTVTSSHVYTLPAGIVAGDLILVIANKGSTSATFNSLAGWSELIDVSAAFGNTVWYRAADGAEGATVTFTSSANTRSAALLYRISNAADITVSPPEISTVATGTSVSPNATTVTPTGGAKNYLWITFWGLGAAGEAVDNDTFCSAAPTGTGYGNLIQKACGTVGSNLGGIIAAARKTANAASDDAGAFTATSCTWNAYTIAVHPFSGNEGTKTGTINLTGTETNSRSVNGSETGQITLSGSQVETFVPPAAPANPRHTLTQLQAVQRAATW